MNIFKLPCVGFLRILLAVVLLLGMRSEVAAQVQPQSTQDQNQNQSAPDKTIPPAQTAPAQNPPPQAPAAEKPEVKITPRQAEELFHSVDEILAFDSKQTGLPIKKPVKRRLTSRDEVEAYLTKHMKDEDVKRLQRSELVLKKFGLLPRDFDLEKLLVALLREQVAGYYDPKTKTVNLLDWVPIEEQEPVMAHELTHALQDQAVGLDKWMKRGEKDLGEIRRDPTPTDIENDEMDDSREAVIEGQAEAVMMQYELAPVGHSILDSPDLVDAMESQMSSGTDDSKVFKDAPIFLRESLTFPYSYGLKFEIKLLEKGGKQQAFAGVLASPPHTTRQIMQPETYLSGEQIPAHASRSSSSMTSRITLSLISAPWASSTLPYSSSNTRERSYQINFIPHGAADIIMRRVPSAMLPHRWVSSTYLAGRRPEKASEFAEIYAHSLAKRYKKVEEVTIVLC